MSARWLARRLRAAVTYTAGVGGACALVCAAGRAQAQTVRIPAGVADSAVLARAMPTLAREILGQYRDADSARALGNRFRLQLVAGQYDAAARSAASLRALRAAPAAPSTPGAPGAPQMPTPAERPGAAGAAQAAAADAADEIWARGMATSVASGRAIAATLPAAFRSAFASFDDEMAARVIRVLGVAPRVPEDALRRAVAPYDSGAVVTLPDALALVRAYQRVMTHRSFGAPLAPLFDEDDARRYVVERNVRVRTRDGATVCSLVMRPRAGTPRRPTLLTFTIYVDSAANLADARGAAAHGYVGVVGFTRGKACSPDTPVPYRHDGRDAAALIDWIAAQPWSDGRVGMYGGSYNGFTAWATTKHMPKALRALMVGAPVAPGLDVPMEGNIVWNFIYPWPLYTTNNKTLDNATYFDNARWRRLTREWYVTGARYRDLPRLDGTPNPVFEEWLAHPAYDAYWQAMIPHGDQFARVTIPVLQTAGYYYGGPGAATYYLGQHYAHDPAARHYLLIGPYDHVQAQRGVVDAFGDVATNLAGYETDPAAHIDIVTDLRYRWFDWVLRGGPRPSLLADRVNYEVMGLDTWKHAPSVAAMANGVLRLYLRPASRAGAHRLAAAPGASDAAMPIRVNLAERRDVDSIVAGGGVRDTAVNTYDALTFVSDPLDDVELSGLYSGHLALVTNKRDFDLSLALFELTSAGEYVQLPPLQIRASHARSLSTRRLLTPGVPQTLDVRAVRLMSRRLERGSRLVAVIGPIKHPGQQINYGTGRDVSDESIADAGEPLEIRFLAGSYLELPTWRAPRLGAGGGR